MYRSTRVLLSSLVLLIAMAVCYLPVLAQSGATTASVSGSVTDEQNAVIGGAVVTAKNVDTNFTREVTTGENGAYLLQLLPPGTYQISAQAEGFARKVATLTLTIGTTVQVNFTMPLSATGEVVEISADSLTALEPDKTEKSTVIDDQAITGLPINRRNFLDFALTTAGVVQDRLPLQGAQATSGLNFNGQNARQNNITIDGLDNNDLNSGSVRSTYSQEAVQEFQVVSNSFSAEFGRAQGGVVNIVTKSGTNDYHGSIFFLNRNDALSARNAFTDKEGEFDQYQFGATLGGAIKKDRAFFFTSFERLTVKDALNVNLPDTVVAALNRQNFDARNGAIPFSEGNTAVLGRLDLKLSQNDQLNVRYNYANNYNGALEPFGGVRTESVGGLQRLRDDNITVSNTFVAPALNLVNETRFLYGRRDVEVDPLDTRGPRLNVAFRGTTVVAGRSTFLPSPRLENIYELVNNTTLTRGRQTIKFGIDYLRVDLPEGKTFLPVGFAGQGFFNPLSFAPLGPAFDGIELFDPALRSPQQQAFLLLLGSLLPTRFPGFPRLDLTRLSIPVLYIQGFGDGRTGLDLNYFSAYVQDDIRINRKFTLKLGLRYDRENVDIVPDNDGNFSPRVALAYRITDKVNFHGSYGIFHGVTPFAPILNLGVGTNSTNPNRIAVLPFPLSILPFAQPGRMFPQGPTFPPGLQVVRQLGVEQDIQPDYKNGYTQQVNAGFDFLLDNKTVISASYQYVRGVKLYLSREINPVVRPIPGDPLGSRIRGRVDPTRGNVQEVESNGDSYYNALTLEARRRFGSNVAFLVNYTYSKTIDTYADYRVELVAFQDPLNLRNERGLSVQDVRNRFVASGVWNLNYTKNPFLRDFVVSSIVTLESGRPYNPRAGVDLDMNADLTPGDRPIFNGAPVARNSGVTPGFATVDLRLTRRFPIKERYAIEGFFEAFNLFNRVNILTDFNNTVFPPNPDGTFTLPPQEDGRFILPKDRQVNAFAPRRFQFGFRFTY